MPTTPQEPADGFVPAAAVTRRHGTRPVASVDDLAESEDPFDSDEEYEEFLAATFCLQASRHRVSLLVQPGDRVTLTSMVAAGPTRGPRLRSVGDRARCGPGNPRARRGGSARSWPPVRCR